MSAFGSLLMSMSPLWSKSVMILSLWTHILSFVFFILCFMLLCFGFCVGLQFLDRLCRSMSWFPLCLVVKSPLVFVKFHVLFFPCFISPVIRFVCFWSLLCLISIMFSCLIFPQLCLLSLMCVFKPCFLGLILCFYCASINLKPISSLVSILSIFRSTDL